MAATTWDQGWGDGAWGYNAWSGVSPAYAVDGVSGTAAVGAPAVLINSNITVNVSNGQAQSNATGSNSSELGRKLEGAVKQVIVGELRPGGLLASR